MLPKKCETENRLSLSHSIFKPRDLVTRALGNIAPLARLHLLLFCTQLWLDPGCSAFTILDAVICPPPSSACIPLLLQLLSNTGAELRSILAAGSIPAGQLHNSSGRTN